MSHVFLLPLRHKWLCVLSLRADTEGGDRERAMNEDPLCLFAGLPEHIVSRQAIPSQSGLTSFSAGIGDRGVKQSGNFNAPLDRLDYRGERFLFS